MPANTQPISRSVDAVLGPMLRLALQTGSSSALAACLERGDPVNARDGRGRTPLMLAAMRGHLDCCKLLLQYDADLGAVDPEGKSATEWALDAGHTDIVALLNQPAARSDTIAGDVVGDPLSTAVVAAVEAIRDADGSATDEGGDPWEAEISTTAPRHDPSCVVAARAIQRALDEHVVIDRDEDWRDVEADIPFLVADNSRWALETGLKADLHALFSEAIDTGWMNPKRVVNTLIGESSDTAVAEVVLLDHVLRTLGDVSVLVDDDAWTSTDESAPSTGNRQDGVQAAQIDDAIDWIEGLNSPRHDPLWAYARDVRQAGHLLSHEEEIALGTAMDDGVACAVEILCSSRQTADLLLRALSDPEIGRRRDVGQTRDDGRDSEDVDVEDSAESDNESRSSNEDALREFTRLVYVGLESDDPAPLGIAKQNLRAAIKGLGLSSVHINQIRDLLVSSSVNLSIIKAVDSSMQRADAARQKLIACNLRLVLAMARKYMFSGMPLADLVQEGNIGLIKAVDRYDHARGFRFSTYATWWIRQALSRGVAEYSRLIRLPVHMFERVRHVERVANVLQAELSREALPEEIAARLDLPAREVVKALTAPREPISLDDDEHSQVSVELFEVADESPMPDSRQESFETAARISFLLSSLSKKEAMVLRMRYGIGCRTERTLEEVGRALEVTRERARQIEAKALKTLTKWLRPETMPKVAEQADAARAELVELDEATDDRGGEIAETIDTGNLPHQKPSLPASSAETGSGGSDPCRAIRRALDMLSSPETQLSFASTFSVSSYQREFAHFWFAAYNPFDTDAALTAAHHDAFRKVSDCLRCALRVLGFGEIGVQTLIATREWKEVMAVAGDALAVLGGRNEAAGHRRGSTI